MIFTKVSQGLNPMGKTSLFTIPDNLPPHMDYALAVLRGDIVTGNYIRLACERSIKDHSRKCSGEFPYRFIEDAAQDRITFAEKLPITAGPKAGQRYQLMDWQRWVQGETWGWRERDDTSALRFFESMLEVGKGAGKTPMLAWDIIYTMVFGLSGVDCCSYATREPQARLCFKVASNIISSPLVDPEILPYFQDFQLNQKYMINHAKNTEFTPLPATPRNLDGFTISFLVLDEATSALDSTSEQEVQKGIQALLQGRTAIVIAHRLSTIINSDRILVMKNGQIVEQGSHQSLIDRKSEYAKLYKLQHTVNSKGIV